jgi:hypothetical protein
MQGTFGETDRLMHYVANLWVERPSSRSQSAICMIADSLSPFAVLTPVVTTYTLTYTAGPNGTISGPASQTVNSGENGKAVWATPNAGFRFVNWSDGSTTNPRTDTNVTANVSVSAAFAINTYTLTYTAGPNGTISGPASQTVNSGASGKPVTAIPNAGYHFVAWSDGSTTNPRTDTKVTASLNVTARFAATAKGDDDDDHDHDNDHDGNDHNGKDDDRKKGEKPEIVARNFPEQLTSGRPFTFQFSAKSDTPIVWSLDGPPAGVSINPATGVLSWTPAASQLGKQTITVSATNRAGTAKEKYRVDVVKAR